jgi:hypothetical protein
VSSTRRGENRDSGEVEALDRFFDSLSALDEVRLLAIYAAWQARDIHAHEHAWNAVIAAAATAGLTGDMERARDAALNWAIRGTNAPWPYGRTEDMHLELRRHAGPALADAAVAVLLGRRLADEDSQTLLGPWVAGQEPVPANDQPSAVDPAISNRP